MDDGTTAQLTCRESGCSRPVVLLHGAADITATLDEFGVGRLRPGRTLDGRHGGLPAGPALAGRQHGGFPPETLRAMADLIPTCRLDIPDGGHMLHHDQPAAVASALAAFLDAAA